MATISSASALPSILYSKSLIRIFFFQATFPKKHLDVVAGLLGANVNYLELGCLHCYFNHIHHASQSL